MNLEKLKAFNEAEKEHLEQKKKVDAVPYVTPMETYEEVRETGYPKCIKVGPHLAYVSSKEDEEAMWKAVYSKTKRNAGNDDYNVCSGATNLAVDTMCAERLVDADFKVKQTIEVDGVLYYISLENRVCRAPDMEVLGVLSDDIYSWKDEIRAMLETEYDVEDEDEDKYED